ncbi:MAG: hypothetical protein L3V56_02845 [Candidatus Magnetoovum sp. WYHC-5]|nr:hypothetical protein [Candidatus Magnetoovum sp. WYHC-5]
MEHLTKDTYDDFDNKENVFSKMVGYSYALVEYMGVISYSYVKAGSELIGHSAITATTPIWGATKKSYKFTVKPIGNITKKSLKATMNGYKAMAKGIGAGYKKTMDICTTKKTRQLNRMEELLIKIDERLVELGRHGVIIQSGNIHMEKQEKRQLSKERDAFLKGIVQENIALRDKSGV